MTVDIEKVKALAEAAKSGGAEWSDLHVDTERMYVTEGALVSLYEFATPAVLLELCNDNGALRGLYQMHKQTETREMRDLKAENERLKTGYEAYERVNAELRAECEALRKPLLAAREFIMHEAEVRGLLDENNEVSFRHPRRQATIAAIDAALSKEAAQ
ncbi:Uncharacterized protein ALO57_00143 [Pseudomonas coronafaciens pv. oryzae]|uniref:hypothetical protein n=1 Tax=Pseudomonas coronafaciens TaxID=53409 RepID=UPI0006B4E59C|nr:hypothetical protein [Pseudomonas coronafaciens]KPB51357.1 Uncharacterized protein AC511_1515 [Pseudomonas coronafaciens pv. oryzae]KPY06223.1 Uncharacterized protein ALO57_00143 [Pseudomonas coronafaciens pv. oryzae]RMT01720.1 hypothetical protein ALP55_03212 [Pseudomonas coronafaciens pv. oryzae]